jgi:hydrogenase maturation protease
VYFVVAVKIAGKPQPVLAAGSKVLILGLGNDILTDDAVGLHVVRELRRRLADEPEIAVEETCEMGLALLDYFVGRHAVIIVDSIQTGRVPPGTIHEVDANELKQLTGHTPHFMGVGETLALGHRLGLTMPERVEIFAIEVGDPFTLGTEMTVAVAGAVPEVLRRLLERVHALQPGALPAPQPG